MTDYSGSHSGVPQCPGGAAILAALRPCKHLACTTTRTHSIETRSKKQRIRLWRFPTGEKLTEYQKQHDLSDRIGQTAGIDPASGRIWFGESIQDIVCQRDAQGLHSPLFFERVGSETYFRKGGRQ